MSLPTTASVGASSRIRTARSFLAAKARALLRRIAPRRLIDGAFDWVRFKIDTFGAADYQPIADAEGDTRVDRRVEGTISRWESIAPLAHALGVRTAVDIGCNVGWFSLRLADLGITTVGVEGHPPLYRTAMNLASRRSSGRMSVLAMHVTPETVKLVPHADCILFLAVWHHLVRRQGQEAADIVLRELWGRAERILFFETGETPEMPGIYRLPPMDPTPSSWIHEHLERNCPGGEILELGLHASSPAYARSLFAVTRKS